MMILLGHMNERFVHTGCASQRFSGQFHKDTYGKS